MSDRIAELIEEVKSKAMAYRDQASTERTKNEELSADLNQCKEQLEGKEAEIEQLKAQVSELENSANENKISTIESPSAVGLSDSEIDDLVKEIDFCIAQLKK